MKLQQRFILSFLFIASLLLVVGGVGWWAETTIQRSFTRTTQEVAPSLIALGEIQAAGARMQEWVLSLTLAASVKGDAPPPAGEGAEEADGSEEAYRQAYASLKRQIDQYAALARGPDDPARLTAIREASAVLYERGGELLETGRQGGSDEALHEQNEVLEAAEAVFTSVTNQTIQLVTEQLKAESQRAHQTVIVARWANLAAIIFGILLALWLGYALSSSVTRPMDQLIAGIRALAKGNYRTRVEVSQRDEFGMLAVAFNEMAGRLMEVYDRLEKALALRDELIAKVSHELRTPLTSIKEGVNLVIENALGPTTAEQRDFLKTTDQDIDRLTVLVSNMLDISRIETGHLQLRRQQTEIPKLIDAAMRSYRPVFGNRTVSTEYGEMAPVFADADRMQQVLGNLLSNAIKFTGDDGRITVRASRRNNHVEVVIEDDGIGISSEDLPRLFQKFSQVGVRDPAKPHGTGLGLLISKELVERHKGQIRVTSRLGQGTRFTFSLPRYTPTFALNESFQDLMLFPAPTIGLIAVKTDTPVGESFSGSDGVKRLGEAIRRLVHASDVVLEMEPPWVVILALTDGRGIQAIIQRLQASLPDGARLQFGAALHPIDGADPALLFAHATRPVK